MDTFKLQATGWPEITVHGAMLGASLQRLDARRAVQVKLYQRDEATLYEGLPYLGEMRYLTEWPMERTVTRLFQAADFERLCDHLREAASTVLPPGAGYPATSQYRERQTKLAGQLQTLALEALTFAISQYQLGNKS